MSGSPKTALRRWSHRLPFSRQASETMQLQAILAACHEGIILLDMKGQIQNCNPSAVRILGFPSIRIQGANTAHPMPFFPIDEQGHPIPEEKHPSRIVLATGEACLGRIHGLRSPEGYVTWLMVNAQPVKDEHGVLTGVVLSFSDITAMKHMEAQLRQEAYYDELTQLHNRRYFVEAMKRAINASRRHGHPMSLCICDLDRFKLINDTHGHLTGDRALQSFAETIQLGLRQDDLAARLGGDEFCILFAHSTAENAAQFLERLRAMITESPVLSEQGIPITLSASFGVANLHPEMNDEALLQAADNALYKAKQEGRNRVAVIA
ncbi:MAG TPA: diguanylate cyclase [Holophaga sp.]|nr:diguanylate cyclase [Holophaga sp.]